MRYGPILVLVGTVTLGTACEMDLGLSGLDGLGIPDPCDRETCPWRGLQGHVTEGGGTPVASAIVSAGFGWYYAELRSDTTDANGWYSLAWEASSTCGSALVSAKHPNGQVQADTIEVCSSTIHNFNF